MPATRIRCQFCRKRFWASRIDTKWCGTKCRTADRAETAKFETKILPQSGIPGITFDRRLKRWSVKVKLDGEWKYVGVKRTLEEAKQYMNDVAKITTLHTKEYRENKEYAPARIGTTALDRCDQSARG